MEAWRMWRPGQGCEGELGWGLEALGVGGGKKLRLPALAGRRALKQIVFRFAREGTIALAGPKGKFLVNAGLTYERVFGRLLSCWGKGEQPSPISRTQLAVSCSAVRPPSTSSATAPLSMPSRATSPPRRAMPNRLEPI